LEFQRKLRQTANPIHLALRNAQGEAREVPGLEKEGQLQWLGWCKRKKRKNNQHCLFVVESSSVTMDNDISACVGGSNLEKEATAVGTTMRRRSTDADMQGGHAGRFSASYYTTQQEFV
jgi:hypothetical protein